MGSGLDGHSRAMVRLLRNPGVQTIIVEHRDRLMRFVIEYVEAAMAAQGRTLLVIDPDEMNDDIAGDLHEAIVSQFSRLYGKSSAKNRAKRALEVAAGPSRSSAERLSEMP